MHKLRYILGATVALAMTVAGLQAQNQNPVQVVNTPNVKVVNTPGVTVANTTPIPVTGTVGVANTENPARSAAQQSLSIFIDPGTSGTTASIHIPTGRIFVLEFVSFATVLQVGEVNSLKIFVTGPRIDGSAGTTQCGYDLLIPAANSIGQTIGSQALRLYAQPGTDLVVDVELTQQNTSSILCQVSLSGYFVSTP